MMIRSMVLFLVVNRRDLSRAPRSEPARAMTAARMRTRPTAICWASAATSMKTSPVVMICIRSSPRKEPRIVPRPPDRLAPPTMTAAMTRSSAPVPALASMALARLVTMTPVTPARNPVSMKANVLTRAVAMPVSRAASSLLPTK